MDGWLGGSSILLDESSFWVVGCQLLCALCGACVWSGLVH